MATAGLDDVGALSPDDSHRRDVLHPHASHVPLGFSLEPLVLAARMTLPDLLSSEDGRIPGRWDIVGSQLCPLHPVDRTGRRSAANGENRA